jgi:hypothetical protein
MQEVEGSSPFSRLTKGPQKRAFSVGGRSQRVERPPDDFRAQHASVVTPTVAGTQGADVAALERMPPGTASTSCRATSSNAPPAATAHGCPRASTPG